MSITQNVSVILYVVMKMRYERIKKTREDLDLTQQELADYLHLTRSAYSNYENDIRDIPVEVLSALADFYHTTVDYLIGRTDGPRPYHTKED